MELLREAGTVWDAGFPGLDIYTLAKDMQNKGEKSYLLTSCSYITFIVLKSRGAQGSG